MKDPFSALPRLKGPALLDKAPATGSSLDNLANLRVRAPTDWERILSLGFDPGLTEQEVDAISRLAIKPQAYAEGMRLLPPQAWCYAVLRETGAFFAPVGVGWGKTFISLLTAAHFYEQGYRKILLCMEPNGWVQLNNRDIPQAQSQLNIGRLPFHRLGMRTLQQRADIVASNAPGCYLMPYSLMSTKDATDMLYGIKPTVIILDEAHNVCNRQAARTKRLFSYIREAKPFVCPMSGTMVQKSIMDYHHLLVASLGVKAPIPLNPSDALEWAVVLDSGCEPSMSGIHRLVPLMAWAQKQDSDKYGYTNDLQTSFRRVRMCYQLRLRSAPGVVSTNPDADIGTSLVIANREVETCEGFEDLEKLINQVSNTYVTPNGDDIDHAIHTYGWLRQLSCGFWYRLDWPEVAPYDIDKLDRSKAYHQAENEFSRELRAWLSTSARPHLDTPLLVRNSLDKHGSKEVGDKLHKAWKILKGLDFEGRIERVQTPVRVCPYKIDAAVRWAEQQRDGIIWYEYNEAGQWLMEALRARGVNALHCPAGRIHDEAILQSNGRIVVAGIDAHGTGKNLQFHTNQYCFQFPRRAKQAEQLLGRTHRFGQLADELVVLTNNTIDFDHMCFSAMLIDSLFVTQTQGIRRKVIFASYDPMPKIFPPEVLMERGFHDIRQLSEQGRKQLQTLFGG